MHLKQFISPFKNSLNVRFLLQKKMIPMGVSNKNLQLKITITLIVQNNIIKLIEYNTRSEWVKNDK